MQKRERERERDLRFLADESRQVGVVTVVGLRGTHVIRPRHLGVVEESVGHAVGRVVAVGLPRPPAVVGADGSPRYPLPVAFYSEV